MIKKISDISVSVKKEEKKVLPSFRKEFKISKKIFFLFFFFLFLFLVYFTGIFFSKTKIKIWILPEEIKETEIILVDTSVDSSDFQNKILAAKIFETKEEISEEFSSSGKILKKAQGKIRLFNEYTTEQENWLEGTRFVSADGKVFKSKNKIVVPGAKIKDGKIEPSFVDVEVEAAEGGAEYNIGPSDFSVLAFKGTPRYFKYYGKSFEPMRGGGESFQVKREDLERAEQILKEKIEQKAQEILEKKVPPELIFPQNSFFLEILSKNFTAKEGEEKEKFKGEIEIKIKTIVSKKEEILNLAKTLLLSKISSEREINVTKVNLKGERLGEDFRKLNCVLEIEAKNFPKMDLEELKENLTGKKIEEAQRILLSLPAVSKVKIDLFPFWSKKISNNKNAIEIFYYLVD